MNNKSSKKSKTFLAAALLLQLITVVTIIFDVPLARQVVGFIYFSFVPGFLFIQLLKIKELDGLETVLFSVGLSVTFLMLAGLVINEFAPLYNLFEPLSLIPLMTFFNSLLIIGGVLAYVRSENIKLFGSENLTISPLALLLIVLPILSVVGAIYVDIYQSNLILLIVIMAIALLFAVGIMSKKLLPPKLYPLVLFLIAISLLFHSVLISKYLVTFQSDVPLEHYVFEITEVDGFWNSNSSLATESSFGRLNSMLSITILPTIYSVLLKMDYDQVLQIIFPLIFAFVPLVLYQYWRKIFGNRTALIAAFLFMAQMTFYTEMMGLARQMIGELFFALLLLVILNKSLKSVNKMLFFILFSIALVVSHYALAEILFFFFSFALISLIIAKKPSINITVPMVMIFFVIMFSWYIFTSASSTFDTFISFGTHVLSQLGDFLNPASRGTTVLRGLGLEGSSSLWNTISRGFAYLTEMFIVLGFVTIIRKRKDIPLKREHFLLILTAGGFLVALVAVPGLAQTMNMTRFYHVLLFFLAPLFVLGAELIAKLMFKHKKEIGSLFLLAIVLVPYFLFQTGFVYEVTGTESWSLPLSKNRMDNFKLYYSLGYVDDLSVYGARWMKNHTINPYAPIYADLTSAYNILPSYGSVHASRIQRMSNTSSVEFNSTIYLCTLNVLDRLIVETPYSFNLDEFTYLDSMHKIYANGGSEIYRNPNEG